MREPLLIEVGVEELPAIPFLKELPNLSQKWQKVLNELRLEAPFELYFTPRRLVIYHENFPLKQPDKTEELYGPPVEVAFKDGEPTKAGLGFAKKAGIDLNDAGRIEKGGKEVLYLERTVAGESTSELLGSALQGWLESLHFGKTMRWGDLKTEFIRPVRWILALLGEKSIDMEIFGVCSRKETRPHRSISFDPVTIQDSTHYFQTIPELGVVLTQAERYDVIHQGIDAIEKEHGVKVERDAELIDELVAITEHPRALLGRFDEKFLRLPPEVIITSMKEHQRYLAVYEGEKLTNAFVVVSNAHAEDFSRIVAGNEKVLRARLSDALFFFDNDLKAGFQPEQLKQITFVKELGSMHDKIEREAAIAGVLGKAYHEKLQEQHGLDESSALGLLERTAMLAKADLVSEVVYEFTELQGIMGFYYAQVFDEPGLVARAIRDQYLPAGEESELPEGLFGSVIAMSYKLDNLFGLFSAGMIPSGTKDPFALRRAAIGLVRIVREQQVSLDLPQVYENVRSYYHAFDFQQLEQFVLERLGAVVSVNPSVIKAVLDSGERDILEILRKIEAVDVMVQRDDFESRFSTFKRVANISKDVDLGGSLEVDSALLEVSEEKVLWESFQSKRSAEGDYVIRLESLFSLKPELDQFFDNVMVNAEDEKLRTNRKNLVASIYQEFRQIADIKEISI